MTFLANLRKRFRDAVMPPPITVESLRQKYAQLSDAQLEEIDTNELTPMAAEALKAERAARNTK